jgi:hypothetical protein
MPSKADREMARKTAGKMCSAEGRVIVAMQEEWRNANPNPGPDDEPDHLEIAAAAVDAQYDVLADVIAQARQQGFNEGIEKAAEYCYEQEAEHYRRADTAPYLSHGQSRLRALSDFAGRSAQAIRNLGDTNDNASI